MEEVTKVLPAIALRGTTILPDMIVHFDISRPKSVRAVEEAMLGDQKIFLIAQKDPDTEVPGLLDVYKIGTIAVIKQVVRMPKDVLRILVEAERRAELLNFEEEESEYLRAEVALFTGSDEMQFSDIEQEAMLRNLKELFAVYCEQTQKVSKELAGQILGTEEVGKLVDQICMNLPLDYVNRQKLLEAVELSERYDTLCVMIANEIQIQEIRSEIQGKIKERIDKNQRDYILREQLKVIREELGEDNSRTEIENYKKQLEKLKASKEVKERISEEIHRLENSASNPSEAGVIRGYIGIGGREIAPMHTQGGGIDQIQGIVVNEVAPGGPAANAGIQVNDVIVSVNGTPAVSALETMDQVAEIRPGSIIPVEVMRNDKKLTLHVTVQEYPATN